MLKKNLKWLNDIIKKDINKVIMAKRKPKTLEEWHEQFRKEADAAMRVSPKTRRMVDE